MSEREMRFLQSLCGAADGTRERRCLDGDEIGLGAGLSVFEAATSVAELEMAGFIFTTPQGEVWLTGKGAKTCPLLTPIASTSSRYEEA